MRSWIDLLEGEIPDTTYGYWITDTGEYLPVPFEGHDAVARENGTTFGHALDAGWVRIVIEGKSTLTAYFQVGRVQYRAISALRNLSRRGYSQFILEVRGGAKITKSGLAYTEFMRLVRHTSAAGVAKWTSEDWKAANS